MDIRPPKKVAIRSTLPTTELPAQVTTDQSFPTMELPEVAEPTKAVIKKPRKHRIIKWTLIGVVGLAVVSVLAAFVWYNWAISPYSNDESKSAFIVSKGDTYSVLAKHLEDGHFIRSALALEVYIRLHSHADTIIPGVYEFSPSQSVSSILDALASGKPGVHNVLIPPGLTLKQLADPSITGSFASQGFSQAEIQEAFAASYASQLLKDKPSSASLEGYIFPETFQAKIGDSLESILERSFDELYGKLQADSMVQKFSEKGLSLYQALTMASIIQKETDSPASQKQVAQVFLLRLQTGMSLGSDVTFIYAAEQLGIKPTPELDSPYNTRIHTGLPPGPVATMNYSALEAVADPAPGDYLFFVAGDDGTIHFSRSNDEHQQQVQQYCKKLCTAQ